MFGSTYLSLVKASELRVVLCVIEHNLLITVVTFVVVPLFKVMCEKG